MPEGQSGPLRYRLLGGGSVCAGSSPDSWSPERGIVPQPVGLGQIKKFWTRRGNVTKEDMVAEARARGFDPVDGNEAIALALLHWRVILGSSDDVALAA